MIINSRTRQQLVLACALVTLLCVGSFSSWATELTPQRLEPARDDSSVKQGRFSDRTLVLGIEVDRDQARLLRYSVKKRPFIGPVQAKSPRPYKDGEKVQLEVILLGPGDLRHTQRVDAGQICLLHEPDAEAHIVGDTFTLHRDAFLVEVPEVAGFDRIRLAYHVTDGKSIDRRPLGEDRLDASRFTMAGREVTYRELMFADPEVNEPPATRSATGVWPEDHDDTDIYHVYGEESEVDRRINIVIVPDGYKYSEKDDLEDDADDMVAYLQQKSPYKEHAPFINYVLVYAYSVDSGTDQCDCGIIKDTAMGMHFPEDEPGCEAYANRCIKYGYGACDTSGLGNITEAEMRVPGPTDYNNKTIFMVNTSRFGGCSSGGRAAYTAGWSSALSIASHELGHLFAGLADEYDTWDECGTYASEVNTSEHALAHIIGAWPEWVDCADPACLCDDGNCIGAPKEGAQYYEQCIYRPLDDCQMRSNNEPFCPVCKQRFALKVFGHGRVAPTAPIESSSPSTPLVRTPESVVDFDVATRLATGTNVTNSLTWTIEGPGYAEPTVVATDDDSYQHLFQDAGDYELTFEVVADTNFVKPEKYGANRESETWEICVQPPTPDCNENGVPDACEMIDCNGNGQLDICDVISGSSEDCDKDEIPDECDLHYPDVCSDGQWCNGLETCDEVTGCQDGTPPCALDQVCEERTRTCIDECPPSYGCGGGNCRQKLPPQCSYTSFGMDQCHVDGRVIGCPRGTSLLKKRCACEAIKPGSLCLNFNQSVVCQ